MAGAGHLFAALLLIATAHPSIAETRPGSGWVPTFADEFDGAELDLTRWVPHAAQGGASNLDRVELRGGKAALITRREGFGFAPVYLSTFGLFAQSEGRFEIRLKAPEGKGLESQIRLLPVPSGNVPAIDLVTIAGNPGEPARFENRWGDERTERAFGGSWPLTAAKSNAPDGFHVFAAEWDAGKIVWFIDGKERLRSTTGIPKQPLYLELSIAIGSPNAKWPDSTTPSPSELVIDYVRVYKHAP